MKNQLISFPLFLALIMSGIFFSCNEETPLVDPEIDLMQSKTKDFNLTPMEQLGKEIFFDKISEPDNMACADCHGPDAGFTGPIAGTNLVTAIYPGAISTRFGNRKPPSAAYATFSPIFHYDETEELFIGGNFWDGRATGEVLGIPAADQALGPFLNQVEHNNPDKQSVLMQIEKSKYSDLWEVVHGESIKYSTSEEIDQNYDLVGLSIAAFEASSEVNQFSSKFDAWVSGTIDLTDEEKLGLFLFNAEDKGNCSACHPSGVVNLGGSVEDGFDKESANGALFTDFSFDNLGTPRNPDNPFYDMDKVYLDDGSPINPLGIDWVDPGLGGFLLTRPEYADKAGENMGKHKVPTLRNVAKGPAAGFINAYMHNGVFKTLKEVVHFYNTRDVEDWPAAEVTDNVNTDELGNLGLTEDEEDAIVAFMETLSDGYKIKDKK